MSGQALLCQLIVINNAHFQTFAKIMGRPFSRKPRHYSELDLNGNLSKPMKKEREDLKIKLFGGERVDTLNEQNHAWRYYNCHCGKIIGHWNPSVWLNNIRYHLEVKQS